MFTKEGKINMNKIKILDIASTDKGAYTLLRTRVKKIEEDNKFENFIVCPSGKWQDKMIEEGVKIIDYKVARELGINSLFKEIKSLEKIIYEYNPDIVHSHNSKTGALARIAVRNVNKKNKKNIKMIHQVHGYHFTTYRGFKKYIFLQIENILAKFTDILLFQNKYELEISKQIKMNKKSQLIYIGNGINFEEFNDISLCKINDVDEVNIVCVARIEPVKNHSMLLQAVNILKNKYNIENFKLFLVGEGNATEIKKYILKNQLQDHVKFTGMLDRKRLINTINMSDISVLTSVKEGKPRALIESIYLGKPCVATDVVGTNEVVLDNYNGFLVELNDSEKFAERLNELITNKKIYKKFSLNAKEYAVKEFDENNIIDKLKCIYLESVKK